MKLTRYEFGEREDSASRWTVRPFLVDPISLFVGQNGSGKSRLMNSIGSLALMLSGKRKGPWPTGRWSVAFDETGRRYDYDLEIENGSVIREQLRIDGKNHIFRRDSGDGEMLSSEAKKNLRFRIPGSSLAASRVDEVQYPYLAPIERWANNIKKYNFGSEFGNLSFFATDMRGTSESLSNLDKDDQDSNAVAKYYFGYMSFGESFDEAILNDFREVGYDCTAVFAVPVSIDGEFPPELSGKIPMMICVQERDLMGPTRQMDMSNGMYRALALIIHLQYLIFSESNSTVIVDDIGEGLDFARSTSLIKLIVRKCKESGIQLLMTTNDRFVMNEVDLKHWHIVHRNSHDVSIFDYENSKEIFDQFIFLGMSNFDFFSREAYLSDSK